MVRYLYVIFCGTKITIDCQINQINIQMAYMLYKYSKKTHVQLTFVVLGLRELPPRPRPSLLNVLELLVAQPFPLRSQDVDR